MKINCRVKHPEKLYEAFLADENSLHYLQYIRLFKCMCSIGHGYFSTHYNIHNYFYHSTIKKRKALGIMTIQGKKTFRAIWVIFLLKRKLHTTGMMSYSVSDKYTENL